MRSFLGPFLFTRLSIFILCITRCGANFEYTSNDYDARPINMEAGWGATKCIDFQEISTIFRPKTFEPALAVTCELKNHQCITIRAVNGTHYYSFQGCVPQARVPRICTELAYEAQVQNGAEFFYCYDVTYDRLNVPANVPLFGRECCCNGDFCNRIENVRTINTIIPHDAILNPYLRILHLWYFNLIRFVGKLSLIATVIFWLNTFYIILKPSKRDDDSAWHAAPQARNQLTDDPEEDMDEENAAPAAEIDGQQVEQDTPAEDKEDDVGASKKKKTKKRRSKKDDEVTLVLQTEKTQELSLEDNLPPVKTVDLDEFKKEDKKHSREAIEKETKKEEKDADNEKKEEEGGKKEEEAPKMFTLPKAKRLANGRIQYVSMFNENSEYDDED